MIMHLVDTPSESGSENQVDMDEENIIGEDEAIVEELDLDDLDEINEEENLNDDVSDDGSITGNEPERDDAICVFNKHTGAVFCCHLEPKTNALAVTGSEDDRAYVWNTTTGDVVFECSNHKDSVIAAEFNHDGQYLATADMSGFIQVWKVATNTVVWSDTIGDLSWLKWHPGSAVLLCSAVSDGVYLWKIPSGQCKVLPSHGSSTDCGIFLPDGRRAAIGYADGNVRIYDLKSCAVLATLKCDNSVSCLDAHSDNNMIAAGCANGQVKLHKTNPAKLVGVFGEGNNRTEDTSEDSSTSFVESVRFSPDPSLSLLVTGYLSGQLLIWDIARQALRHRLQMAGGIVKLLWDRHSLAIHAGLLDGSVSVFDVREGILKPKLLGHRDNILDMTISMDGSKLLTASEDKSARIFNLPAVNR